MLELSAKNFTEAILKILQHAIINFLETNKKNGTSQQRNIKALQTNEI